MNFDSNKPIYLQIADVICEKILSGEYLPDSRIPSVREYGADIGVNPNTVMRTYEKLTTDGVIYNKRGIENERKEFLENEWPAIARRIALLDIDKSMLKI